jgi:DNA-binding HxlR family transcriptional regulator
MKRTSLAHHACSIARTLDVAGEWWTPLILRDVAYGVRRFGEIERDLGISANVLADRLDALVADGLLETRVYQQRPERHEYHLTEMGADLVPALIALMRWGDRWKWPGGKGPVLVTHAGCGGAARAELRCERCGETLGAEDLVATPRFPAGLGPREGEPGAVSSERLHAVAGGVQIGR